LAVIIVRVRPGSASDRIGPYAEGVLSLSVTRPPAEGAATDAARRLLARALEIPPSTVSLVAGARSRTKRFEAAGLTDATASSRLARYRLPAD
jgi:uncharacterized protein YggU (UPF0235/DUF167 family)